MALKKREVVSLDVEIPKDVQAEMERLRVLHPGKGESELYRDAVVVLANPGERHVRIDAASDPDTNHFNGQTTASGTWVVSPTHSSLMSDLLGMEDRMNREPSYRPSADRQGVGVGVSGSRKKQVAPEAHVDTAWPDEDEEEVE